MANLSAVIDQLCSERERTARELERLDNAIAALDHIGRRAATGERVPRGRRARQKFSVAARARMAAAQRARWAKLKAKK
jgi:hypothetical protein